MRSIDLPILPTPPTAKSMADTAIDAIQFITSSSIILATR